jgi:hypothetical protein
MDKTPKLPHPLEGEYIIYNFGEQDHEDEAWALALYQLKNGIMTEIYHPGNHVDCPSEMGARNIEELLRLMEQEKIKKVFSVFHLEDFFGIPSKWFRTDGKQDSGEVEEWAQYKHLSRDDDYSRLLKDRGIIVEFYDATNEKR